MPSVDFAASGSDQVAAQCELDLGERSRLGADRDCCRFKLPWRRKELEARGGICRVWLGGIGTSSQVVASENQGRLIRHQSYIRVGAGRDIERDVSFEVPFNQEFGSPAGQARKTCGLVQ